MAGNTSPYGSLAGKTRMASVEGLLKAAVLSAVLVAAFWPTWAALFAEWVKWDQALAHGLLIAAATLYFMVTSAAQAPAGRLSGGRFAVGLAISLVCLLFAALSQRVAMNAVTQLALVPLLFGLMLVFFPTLPVFRALIISGLLLFALQAWGSLNGLLLFMASEVVGTAVGWLSIPALIDGNSITLPYGIMLIADGCSGLRYFVVSLALAWILSVMNHYRLSTLVFVLAVAAVLALVMNWIRIYTLILIGYYSQMENSLVYDHELFGWVLYAVIALPAMYFAPAMSTRQNSWTKP